MNCLDTDFLVSILRGNEEAKEAMLRLEEQGVQATTAMNTFELYLGAYLSEKPAKNLKLVESLVSRLHVLPLEVEHTKLGGKISADLKRQGEKLDFRDVLTGSIALFHDLTLITRNVKHFDRIQGLKVQTW